jgi:hypothetical protein
MVKQTISKKENHFGFYIVVAQNALRFTKVYIPLLSGAGVARPSVNFKAG